MRLIVIGLALLAGLKIWAQESVYRTATEQALVEAYRERAIATCSAQPPSSGGLGDVAALTADWSRPAGIQLVIGDSQLDVALWEVENEQWEARYKSPYLVLVPGGLEGLHCTFDIARGSARIGPA